MNITSRVQLVELMKHLGLPLIACECGVAEGIWSTELMSLGLKKLYLVDIWDNIPSIQGCASFDQTWHDINYARVKSLFEYDERVVILKGLSYKMAAKIDDETLGMCYLDADHTYEGVKADIHSFYPKLVTGGILAFHDYYIGSGYGVHAAVQEFTKGEGIFELPESGEPSHLGAYFIKK